MPNTGQPQIIQQLFHAQDEPGYDKGYIFSFSPVLRKLLFKEISEDWKLYALRTLMELELQQSNWYVRAVLKI